MSTQVNKRMKHELLSQYRMASFTMSYRSFYDILCQCNLEDRYYEMMFHYDDMLYKGDNEVMTDEEYEQLNQYRDILHTRAMAQVRPYRNQRFGGKPVDRGEVIDLILILRMGESSMAEEELNNLLDLEGLRDRYYNFIENYRDILDENGQIMTSEEYDTFHRLSHIMFKAAFGSLGLGSTRNFH